MCHDYRWAASLDFKQSWDVAATISWAGWSIQVWSEETMTYVCTASYRRGCCSYIWCSFCGSICFLLAVICIQNQWRRDNGETYRTFAVELFTALLECRSGNYHSTRDKSYTTKLPGSGRCVHVKCLKAMLDMCKPGCSCHFCGVGGILPKHCVLHVGPININKRAGLPVYVCMRK